MQHRVQINQLNLTVIQYFSLNWANLLIQLINLKKINKESAGYLNDYGQKTYKKRQDERMGYKRKG